MAPSSSSSTKSHDLGTLFCFNIIILFLFLIYYPSSAAIVSISTAPTTTTSSPDTICPSTPHPTFCKSLLPRNKPGNTIHDYGRFCITESISAANAFLSSINQQLLERSQYYSQPTVRALEDCLFLASRNIDFLSTTKTSIGSTNTSLPSPQAALVQTVLSAIMTNLQTCSDGLVQASGSSASSSSQLADLGAHLSNGTLLSSVSLALVTQGWGSSHHHNTRSGSGRQLSQMRHWHWPLKAAAAAAAASSSTHHHRRTLLQIGGLDVQVNTMVTVDPNGNGDFTSINGAVAAAPNNTQANSGYFAIHVVAGVYQEYVSIPKHKTYLMMVGDGINQTIITGNRSVVDGWTTFASSTFAVVAEGFLAVNITFKNTAGAIKQQAVAVQSGADLSTFYRCSFEAYQDTLYTHSLRQFYSECDIYGTVDFIFGNAAVVFQDCNIFPRQPLEGQFNTITAQGRTDPNQNTGTSIQGATIEPAPDLAASNFTVQTYLGRPWKNYSTTVFMQSYMDSFINPAGWHEWSGTFALDTLYYAEYNNTGPGSNTTARVTWSGYHIINATTAADFTVSSFISGDNWIPATGVPYTGGLL
ncbi:hypothetical protein Dimus_021680 [Dionaea muscipula]